MKDVWNDGKINPPQNGQYYAEFKHSVKHIVFYKDGRWLEPDGGEELRETAERPERWREITDAQRDHPK
ncbi:MAG TPA: hypothetical protein VIL74_14150 [Pyrinomonadaceae bacterium]|jgi:hypothetical protein